MYARKENDADDNKVCFKKRRKRGMKKGRCKKIFVVALALSLLISGVGGIGTVQAEQGSEYDVTKPMVEAVDITPAGTVVNVGDKVEVLVKASDNVAIDTTKSPSIIFMIPGDFSKTLRTSLEWEDERNGFYGTITISDTTYPGEYRVGMLMSLYDTSGNQVEGYGLGGVFPNAVFTVKNDAVDIENPKIISVSMTKAGEKLAEGESSIITVQATDNDEIASVQAVFESAEQLAYGYSKKTIELVREGTSDRYNGMLTVDESWYATEWYLSAVEVVDKTGNCLYARSYDGSAYTNDVFISNADADAYWLEEKYYVYVLQNGTCSLPAYDMRYCYRNAEGEWLSETIKVPRRTPVNELDKYAASLQLPDIPGVCVTGWKLSNSYPKVILGGWYNDVWAQYDKECVSFCLYAPIEYVDGIVEDDPIVEKTIWTAAGNTIEIPQFEGYKDLKWYRGRWGKGTVELLEEIGSKSVTIAESPYIATDYNQFFAKITDANVIEGDDDAGDSGNSGDSGNGGNQDNIGGPDNIGNEETGGGHGNVDNGGSQGNSTVPTKPAVTMPQTQINEIVKEIKEAKSGTAIKIDMNHATVVPQEILKQAQGKDVDVVLEMDGYTWTINGKNIIASDLTDINLEVTRNTSYIPDSVVKTIAGNHPVEQISLTYNGNFGFTAELTLNVGKQYFGQYGNLYYYDSDGRMVLMNTGAIDEHGNVTLGFSHASEYAIVITDVPATENQGEGQEQMPQGISTISPKTSDCSMNIIYIIMILTGSFILLSSVVTVVIERKKSK